jgi:predicted RNA-binding protein (virulence factor B family)
VALEDLLGRVASLAVARIGPHGAFLELPEGSILLPGTELPEDLAVGEKLDVFVYLDSDDRPIATLRAPKVELDEVAFLEVTDVAPFGAFCDWGLQKDLLVPRAEQTKDVHVGERHPIGLYVDDTGRLAGTMRVSEMLKEKPPFERDAWVRGEAWRKDPRTGIFVILERRYVGLLPASEPNELDRGEGARFRVANVLPDGKIEVSLRDVASRARVDDAQKILDVLSKPNAPEVGDRSDPETIFELFGLSKKAFKRAVGGLLKSGAASIDARGFIVVKAARPRR